MARAVSASPTDTAWIQIEGSRSRFSDTGQKAQPLRQAADVLPVADRLVQEVRRRRQEDQQRREAVEQVHRPHQDTTRV